MAREIAVLIPIVAIFATAWVVVTVVRLRMAGGAKGAPDDALVRENERLTGQIGRLEARLAVLERIATDPAERTAREIEELR